MDLACDEHGRREDAVARPLLGGGGLAGQSVLVDHRHAFQNVAVDGHGLAGVDDDHIALVQRVGRHLHLGTVVTDPLCS